MALVAPPQEVIDAVNASVTKITRRAELYESDGVTRWLPNDIDSSRFIDGSVSIDQTRDERRTLDVTLDNTDGGLKHNSDHGLWYDKIIKVFRGVTYNVEYTQPKIVIIEDVDSRSLVANAFKAAGFYKNTVLTTAATFDDIKQYDIIVADGGAHKITKSALIQEAYNRGKAVWTIGATSDNTTFNWITTTTAKTNTGVKWQFTPMGYDTPVNGTWLGNTAAMSAVAGRLITAWDPSAFPVAKFTYNDVTDGNSVTGTGWLINSPFGGRWFHQQFPDINNADVALLIPLVLTWLYNFQASRSKEWQLGEFCIDKIDEGRFPREVKLSCRDYTKKCLLSKITTATTFTKGTPIETLIQSIAANCGINKFVFPQSGQTLAADTSFDRGVERWNVMKNLATTINMELFFDNMGYLVMQPIVDPSTTPAALTLLTGEPDGNLVNWTKSSSDGRVYNRIVVTGDGDQDTNPLGFYGEAINNDSNSPTWVKRIGERTYFYSSSFFTSNQQCIDLANSWLKVKALEEFNVGYTSLVYPWLDVGIIVLFDDPDPGDDVPNRYLLSTLNVPMNLGGMDGTLKRVTIVGTVNDPGIPDAG